MTSAPRAEDVEGMDAAAEQAVPLRPGAGSIISPGGRPATTDPDAHRQRVDANSPL